MAPSYSPDVDDYIDMNVDVDVDVDDPTFDAYALPYGSNSDSYDRPALPAPRVRRDALDRPRRGRQRAFLPPSSHPPEPKRLAPAPDAKHHPPSSLLPAPSPQQQIPPMDYNTSLRGSQGQRLLPSGRTVRRVVRKREY